MKLLLVASTYPRQDQNSVPRFVHDLAIHLRKHRPDLVIHVLAPHEAGASFYEEMDGIKVHRFFYFLPFTLQKLAGQAILPNLKVKPYLWFQVPFLFFSETIAIFWLVLRIKPDLVYSHWFVPQGICCGLVSMISGVPHIFTSHSSDVAIARKVPILGPFLVRFFMSRMTALSVVSRRSKEKIKAFFGEQDWKNLEQKIKIIPMGVYRNREKSIHATTFEGATLLFMGRLVEKKGVKYLLRAFQKILLNYPDAHLQLAGTGPLFKRLQKEARDLGISDSVQFLGHVEGEKKNSCLDQADLVVVPSIISGDGDAEGLPVVLMEALSFGKIVIATDVSGADEYLFNGINGFLITQRNVDQLSNTISQAIELEADIKSEIKTEARRTSLKFDWDIVARDHLQHLIERKDKPL